MKFLIVFTCALAAASAGYLHGHHSLYTAKLATPVYSSVQQVPVIGVNGVPLDTPAVQNAKAAHFAAKAEAYARGGSIVEGVVSPVVANIATPVVSTYSSSLVAPVASLTATYTGAQHVPVIGANGVPVDTPAVQSAKVAHLAAKAEARARNGEYLQGVVTPVVANVATPVVSAYSSSIVAPAVATLTTKYTGPQHVPVIGANGVPVDTPAVQSAKVAHLAAKAEARARNGDFVQGVVAPVVSNVATPVVSAYSSSIVAPAVATLTPKYTGPQHVPVIGANGVPVDTPAVQSAKVAHLAAKAEAHARNGDFVQGVISPVVASVAAPAVTTYTKSFVAPAVAPIVPKYTGPQHLPVIGANGVPVDTAAVRSAKAAHNVHKAEAYARSGDFAQQVVAPVAKVSGAVSTYSGAVVAPAVASAPLYTGPQHRPVIGADGVPVDTPAVQSAKAAHLVAKAKAHARNGDFMQGAVAPVVSTYATAPVVSTYTTKTISPVVSTYAAAPVVSTYASAPSVAAYSTGPVVSTYSTGPVVSTYSTKTITPTVW